MQENYLNINTLSLTDFRLFNALTITFDPQLTVLTAKNGGGKTSVLDALAIAIGPYVGAFDHSRGSQFSKNDIRSTRSQSSREMFYAVDGVKLTVNGCIPNSNSTQKDCSDWSRALTGPKKHSTIKDAKRLVDYGRSLQKKLKTPNDLSTVPVLAYYGTNRLWKNRKVTSGRRDKRFRETGYSECLEPASNYNAFAEEFAYLSRVANTNSIRAHQTNGVHVPDATDAKILGIRQAIDSCLLTSGWKNINYDFDKESMVAEHDQQGRLEIAGMSDGIRNMIGLVADIAFRAIKLNPHLGKDAPAKSPGIVLIDEVDMHLHPEWQQHVLQDLCAAFPRIQFIVTTHSPQVLSTVAKKNIRVLENTESGWIAQEPAFSPLGHDSADALARVMGTHSKPPLDALIEKITQFELMVRGNKENTAEAVALKQDIESEGYEFEDAKLDLWRFIASKAKNHG